MPDRIDFLENDRSFKEAIGSFVIAFSKVEYALAILSSLTEKDIRKANEVFIDCVGQPLEIKLKRITDYIKSELPELKAIWETIRNEIGLLNEERRYIVHGIHHWGLPKDTIRTRVRKGKNLRVKTHTVNQIMKLTNRLAHVETGDYGVNGEFYNIFTKARVDHWNRLVPNEDKIVFKLNGNVMSEWQGQ